MPTPFIDCHAHAQFPIYDADRDAVLARARTAGVRVVNVGTTHKTSEAAVALARAYPDLCYAAIGVHPSHASTSEYVDPSEQAIQAPSGLQARGAAGGEESLDVEYYGNLAKDPNVVAIGECGLDYAGFVRARNVGPQNHALATPAESTAEFSQEQIEATKQKQRELFLSHMKFAKEIRKPLMIHCRSAFPDLLKLLTANFQLLIDGNPGIIHFFTGTAEEANDLLALGFSFTFGGVITFVRDYDPIVRAIPPDRILSETDAPYVTPVPYRGKRNEPSYVVEVVHKLAELRGVPIKKMAEVINENARRIFHI